jgi:hypothetical protein
MFVRLSALILPYNFFAYTLLRRCVRPRRGARHQRRVTYTYIGRLTQLTQNQVIVDREGLSACVKPVIT